VYGDYLSYLMLRCFYWLYVQEFMPVFLKLAQVFFTCILKNRLFTG